MLSDVCVTVSCNSSVYIKGDLSCVDHTEG